MQLKNKSGRKYLSNIRRSLKCSAKLRHGFLKVFKAELCNFELDNPHADYSSYITEFGTPQDVAGAYLAELTRSQRAAYWLPFAALLGIAVISAFILLSALLMSQSNDGFYVVEISPTVSLSDIDEPQSETMPE